MHETRHALTQKMQQKLVVGWSEPPAAHSPPRISALANANLQILLT